MQLASPDTGLLPRLVVLPLHHIHARVLGAVIEPSEVTQAAPLWSQLLRCGQTRVPSGTEAWRTRPMPGVSSVPVEARLGPWQVVLCRQPERLQDLARADGSPVDVHRAGPFDRNVAEAADAADGGGEVPGLARRDRWTGTKLWATLASRSDRDEPPGATSHRARSSPSCSCYGIAGPKLA